MTGFVKIHSELLGSSIMEEALPTRFLWIVVLALADRNGNFRATPSALARMANLPLEDVKTGLQVLQSPDPNSTSEDEEGRRILEVSPNEWHIVNYKKYRSMRDPDQVRENAAERQRKHRAKKVSHDVTKNNDIAEAEAEAEAEADNTQVGISMDDLRDCMRVWNIMAEYHELPLAKNATRKRLSALKARCRETKLGPGPLIDMIIDEVKNSRFLQGDGGRDTWVGATFDWCMRPTNFVKITEGNYRDKKARPTAGQAYSGPASDAEIEDDHKKSCDSAREIVGGLIEKQRSMSGAQTDRVLEQLTRLASVIEGARNEMPGNGYRQIVEAEDFFLDWLADEIEEQAGAPLPAKSATERRNIARKHIGMPVLY